MEWLLCSLDDLRIRPSVVLKGVAVRMQSCLHIKLTQMRSSSMMPEKPPPTLHLMPGCYHCLSVMAALTNTHPLQALLENLKSGFMFCSISNSVLRYLKNAALVPSDDFLTAKAAKHADSFVTLLEKHDMAELYISVT